MKVAKFPSDSAEVVQLNIGGQYYQTTVATLTGCSAYFSLLAEKNRVSTTVLDDGSYFIDRDGEAFGSLLSYMRTWHFSSTLTAAAVDVLEREVAFYGMNAACTHALAVQAAAVKAPAPPTDHAVVMSKLDPQMPDLTYSSMTTFEGRRARARLLTVVTRNEAFWLCARGIPNHTKPGLCGHRCDSAGSGWTNGSQPYAVIQYDFEQATAPESVAAAAAAAAE